jgi:hypothetical protein
MCDLKIAAIELFLVIMIFLSFYFIGFMAGDILSCGLAVRHGVFAPLFTAAKKDNVFRARK